MACKRLYLKDDFPQLSNEGTNPRVDVYLPAPLEEMGREGQKRPVPVICPGGAYRFCSRREAEPIALHFLTDGYCVLVLSYSVAPKMFPRQLQEVAGVLELICQSAEQWHCDTEKIALMGFSAGGHLAAHYANAYDIPQVQSAFPRRRNGSKEFSGIRPGKTRNFQTSESPPCPPQRAKGPEPPQTPPRCRYSGRWRSPHEYLQLYKA